MFAKDCFHFLGKISQEITCGRPLGIRIQGDNLYAVDAYLGVFKIDLLTGKRKPYSIS